MLAGPRWARGLNQKAVNQTRAPGGNARREGDLRLRFSQVRFKPPIRQAGRRAGPDEAEEHRAIDAGRAAAAAGGQITQLEAHRVAAGRDDGDRRREGGRRDGRRGGADVEAQADLLRIRDRCRARDNFCQEICLMFEGGAGGIFRANAPVTAMSNRCSTFSITGLERGRDNLRFKSAICVAFPCLD